MHFSKVAEIKLKSKDQPNEYLFKHHEQVTYNGQNTRRKAQAQDINTCYKELYLCFELLLGPAMETGLETGLSKVAGGGK